MVTTRASKFFKIFFIFVGIFIIIILSVITYFSTLDNTYSGFEYVVVLDCQSNLTKLNLFHFNDDKTIQYLPYMNPTTYDGKPIIIKSNTSLISFKNRPADAAAFLSDLLENFTYYIPGKDLSDVDLYVTLDIKMNINEEQLINKMIIALNSELPKLTKLNFKFIEKITKRKLSFYKWVYVNYLQHNFHNFCGDSINIIDMDDSSLQIGFETSKNYDETFKFQYRCNRDDKIKTHYVYSQAFVGLGIKDAIEIYRKQMIDSGIIIDDNCLPKYCIEKYDDKQYNGTGNQDECFEGITKTFSTYFYQNNIHEITINLQDVYDYENSINPKPVYGLSSFYNSFHDYLFYSGPWLTEFYWGMSKEFCKRACSLHMLNIDKNIYKSNDIGHIFIQCFRVPLYRYLLKMFFQFNEEPPVTNYKSIWGDSIDYTFGAAIYFVTNY